MADSGSLKEESGRTFDHKYQKIKRVFLFGSRKNTDTSGFVKLLSVSGHMGSWKVGQKSQYCGKHPRKASHSTWQAAYSSFRSCLNGSFFRKPFLDPLQWKEQIFVASLPCATERHYMLSQTILSTTPEMVAVLYYRWRIEDCEVKRLVRVFKAHRWCSQRLKPGLN